MYFALKKKIKTTTQFFKFAIFRRINLPVVFNSCCSSCKNLSHLRHLGGPRRTLVFTKGVLQSKPLHFGGIRRTRKFVSPYSFAGAHWAPCLTKTKIHTAKSIITTLQETIVVVETLVHLKSAVNEIMISNVMRVVYISAIPAGSRIHEYI